MRRRRMQRREVRGQVWLVWRSCWTRWPTALYRLTWRTLSWWGVTMGEGRGDGVLWMWWRQGWWCGCGGQSGGVLWMRSDVVVARVVVLWMWWPGWWCFVDEVGCGGARVMVFCGCGGSVLWLRLDVVVARMMVFCGGGGGQGGHVSWMRLDVAVASLVMCFGYGDSQGEGVLWIRLDVVVARMVVFCGWGWCHGCQGDGGARSTTHNEPYCCYCCWCCSARTLKLTHSQVRLYMLTCFPASVY